jgi:putative endonuclease
MACHLPKVTGLFYRMPYYAYIIQSLSDGTCYVGSTQNVEDRLKRHNQGRSQYTKTKRPWQFVYDEGFTSKSDAIKRENEKKRRKSKTFIESSINSP